MNRIFVYAVSVLSLLAGCASPSGGDPLQTGGSGSPQEPPEVSEEQYIEEDAESAPLDAEELLELYRDEETPSLIRVNPDLIRITDEILYGPEHLDHSMIEDGHIADSYVVTRSISYLDHWYREFERYYPRFTNELPVGDGAEAIKAHYQQMYEAALEAADQYAADAFAEVEIDSPMQWQHYNYQNYSRIYVQENYLSVVYDRMDYTGGAHMMYGSWAENFDLATGKLLTGEDIFILDDELQEFLQTLLQAYANPEDDFMWGTRPTVNAGSMYLCDDGITFLFNPYELGSFASGLREITVPYEELAPILLLDVER